MIHSSRRWRNVSGDTINLIKENSKIDNSLSIKSSSTIVNEKTSSGPTLNKTAIENYWKTLWGTPVNHNEQANWLNEEVLSSESIPSMTQVQITTSDIQQTIKRVLNWKAAGPDGIQNFW